MKKYEIKQKTVIRRNESAVGEPLHISLQRKMENKEKLGTTMPLIYTDRKEGVKPEYDIRTDRFDVAIDATTKIDKSWKARRDERHKEKVEKLETIEGTEE